jgi:Macrocin-O-methyltransferase (TylF)
LTGERKKELGWTREMLKSAASGIAPVRRLLDQRDTLLRERGMLTAQVRELLEQNTALREQLQNSGHEPVVAAPVPGAMRYEQWFAGVFGIFGTAPNTMPATSWGVGDPWGAQINNQMFETEWAYAEALLQEIEARGVPGAIVEFGVFRGESLLRLIEACERLGMQRQFFGFDSFEGLSAPSAEFDLDCWTEGDYAASLEDVGRRLEVARRPNVALVKGWFNESLHSAAALAIHDIAFARVDCDLYAPAVTCLDYLSDRLSDGAILVFDDWTFELGKGETRAFAEWVERGPPFRFEFLCFNSIGHLYMRVHARGRAKMAGNRPLGVPPG